MSAGPGGGLFRRTRAVRALQPRGRSPGSAAEAPRQPARSRASQGFAALAASDSRHAVGRGPGVDSISQPAPGLGHDAPAPIRGRALQPEPIVSRSRVGSGRRCPGCPSAEPPAPRRLPAGPHALQPRSNATSRALARSVLPPCTPAEAAAGAAETATGEAAAAGPVMGLGCGAEGPPRPRSAAAFGRSRSGVRSSAVRTEGRGAGSRWDEAWERGAPGHCRAAGSLAGRRALGSRRDCG